MHVLGLPPAFVLSQDQTLKLKRCLRCVLDSRTSAHHPTRPGRIVSACRASLHKETKPPSSEADTPIIGRTLRSRCVRDRSIEMDQTAHKSLQSPAMSKSGETKPTEAPTFRSARPPARSLDVCLSPRRLGCCRRPVWRPVGASAPPVKGYLRFGAGGCKGFFRGT